MSGFSGGSAPFRGCLVKKSADVIAGNYTGALTVLSWDDEVYDTSDIHDTVTNNTRLTVPTGVTRVRLGLSVRMANQTGDTWNILAISKNGLFTYDGNPELRAEIGNTAPAVVLWSPVLTVTGGDYFEGAMRTEVDTAVDVLASGSWFAMEIIE